MNNDIKWIKWDGRGLPPGFYKNDMVQIETRDGRIIGPETEAWMFAGWHHNGGINDIVAYRIIKR